MQNRLQLVAVTSLIALIFLCLAWELWLAPLRPGGSWLALKGVLLLAPLFGLLRGRRYTYQWTSIFVLIYVMEGLVRATSESGLAQVLAILEIALASCLFASVIAYVRQTGTKRRNHPAPNEPGDA